MQLGNMLNIKKRERKELNSKKKLGALESNNTVKRRILAKTVLSDLDNWLTEAIRTHLEL